MAFVRKKFELVQSRSKFVIRLISRQSSHFRKTSSIPPFRENLANRVNLDSRYLRVGKYELISSRTGHLARGLYARDKGLFFFFVSFFVIFRGYFLISMTGRNATVRKRAST
jgi:hypothetical protein